MNGRPLETVQQTRLIAGAPVSRSFTGRRRALGGKSQNPRIPWFLDSRKTRPQNCPVKVR